MASEAPPSLASFVAAGRSWLAERLQRGNEENVDEVADCVAVFHDLGADEEAALIARAAAWQSEKFAAGYGALTWPENLGGAELPAEFDAAFAALEQEFVVPSTHELLRITANLVAPTIRVFGTPYLQARFIPQFLSCAELACQLFSEPSAGSDLANVATKAARDGEGTWIINGSKVWVSGAQFAQWGLLIARSDPSVPKHAGLTAFLLPLDSPGVDIRPLRQMSGGSSFNEIFFDDVRLDDKFRLGDVGDGWKVARTVLAFERRQSGSKSGVGGSWKQLLALARSHGELAPANRRMLVDVYVHERLRELTNARARQSELPEGVPNPSGSIGKLLWSQGLTLIGETAAQLVGPALVADSGLEGHYAWSEHVLGAPGFRIAGGSDEIQRNILAERVLGLPPEPRSDVGVAWKDLPK